MRELIDNINNNIWAIHIIKSIVIIIVSFILYNSLMYVFKRNDSKVFISKKSKTYFKMIRSIIRYLFMIITLLIILKINGIDVSSLLAGVGIIGVIIGFAVQDALKDIIKGVDILSDNYYQVGDVIKYKGIEGKVLTIGLKTTKIEDIRTMNIVSISNRNIEEVEVVSNLISIDVPMPYETKIETAEETIIDIVADIKKLVNVYSAEYGGINNLAASSINYQIKIYCNPTIKLQTRRDALRCIMKGLERHNIEVPYNQIDIHQK